VMGVALLLTGIGFLVLTLGGALGMVTVGRREKAPTTASAATYAPPRSAGRGRAPLSGSPGSRPHLCSSTW
jgi:hypothetical protein